MTSLILPSAVEIIYKLSEVVLQRESDLLVTVEACAELDWCAWVGKSRITAPLLTPVFFASRSLIAFAGAAVDWRWTRPQMTDENVVRIVKARFVRVFRPQSGRRLIFSGCAGTPCW